MKVICIKNKTSIYNYFLTIDKLYNVYNEVNNSAVYLITNDVNISIRYPKYLFITLKEYRKQKLEKINQTR